ncbi:MAG: SET domain-containing protein-lysine N-methyltransferase [Candidatus Lokiarchaeota archaeon]|nr:SET domain-containing protein-lysine N-methyltransferase [Candidatus Lokiarchaeota archaeon]
MNGFSEVKFVSPKKGKGLFAKKNINKGTIIEKAHIILIPNKDYEYIQDTCLYNYIFSWEDPKYPESTNALAMGICQFINHSYRPNLRYLYDYKDQTIEFKALRNIVKGEELTVNYNGKISDKSPLWFKVED